MPPLQMTRAEYQMKYGVAPVLPSASKVDTTPAPRRMTRAEYQAEFGKQKEVERKPGVTYSAFGAVNPDPTLSRPSLGSDLKKVNNYADLPPLKETFSGRKEKTKENINQLKNSTSPMGVMGAAAREGGNILGGAADLAFKGISKVPGFGQAQKFLMDAFGNIVGGGGDAIGSTKTSQNLVEGITDEDFKPIERNLEAAVDYGNFAMLASGAAKSKITVADVVNKGKDIIGKPPGPDGGGGTGIKGYLGERKINKNTEITTKVADEIANIESQYSKTRKANEYSKDADASRKRIAEADVLPDSVDQTGTINSKRAVEEYSKKTIDGKEGVVRENLARLKEKVNLAQVERDLSIEVAKSGLEGADLLAALNGVKNEIKGLKLRADEFGDILLEKVHDAKINTTKNIDYNTPPETKTYRKAVARAYKTIVEENSSFNVKEVNAELSKYYEDITRLENLHGKKVKGGKLGKYSAQIAGNIAGGAVGGAVGGLAGTAVGAIVGGETASFLKGKSMAGTFGEKRGIEMPKNAILEKAGQMAKEPSKLDLTKPSPKVGAPKSIQKTKEIFKLENEIKRNVEMQTKAIKAGDFTLVAKLKEVYDHLVTKLKEVIKKIKDTPNKQGGFAKNPFAQTSKSDISPQKQLSQSMQSSNKNSTSSKESQALATEARKYKSAEEFSNKIIYRGENSGGIAGKPYGNFVKETKTGLPKTLAGSGGLPASKDYATASGFGNEVRAYVAKSDAKILSNPDEIMKIAKVSSAHDFYFKAGKVPPVDSVSFYEKAKLAGYDAVDLTAVEKLHRQTPGDTVFLKSPEQETRIINRNAFTEIKNPPKTKSQLTDFYNKAVGETPTLEKFHIQGKDGKMLGSIPRSKVKTIDTKQIKINESFDDAIGDINTGQKSKTNLPILVKENANGIYEVLDGNHRLAQALRKGETKIDIMTDEKLYRELSTKQE